MSSEASIGFSKDKRPVSFAGKKRIALATSCSGLIMFLFKGAFFPWPFVTGATLCGCAAGGTVYYLRVERKIQEGQEIKDVFPRSEFVKIGAIIPIATVFNAIFSGLVHGMLGKWAAKNRSRPLHERVSSVVKISLARSIGHAPFVPFASATGAIICFIFWGPVIRWFVKVEKEGNQ